MKRSIFASPESVNGKVGVGTCGIADKPMTTYHDTSKYNVRHLMPQWPNILSWCKSILLYSSKIIAYRCVLYGLGYPSKGALKQIACSPLVASLGNCPYQYITQNSRIHNKINDHCNGVAAQIMVVVKLVWVAVSFWMQQRPKKHFHVFNVTHLLSIFQVELDLLFKASHKANFTSQFCTFTGKQIVFCLEVRCSSHFFPELGL